MRRLGLAIVAVLAGIVCAQAQDRNVSGKFDYYLLALSWSPTYCAEPGRDRSDPRQCGLDRNYAFVVHGLWPQNERGYPRACPTTQPRGVPAALAEAQLDLMPSPTLVQHEWEAHGACSGLSQRDYFARLRQTRASLAIPPAYARLDKPARVTAAQVRAAFVAANPGLAGDGIAVICDRTRLREVRVCFNKGGGLRRCSVSVRDQCTGTVTMPPVRPGQGR